MLKEIPNLSASELIPPDSDYSYFENCSAHPFRTTAQQFELVNAWWLADWSLLAYAPPDFVQEQAPDDYYSHIELIEGGGTQCYVAHNQNHAVIVFRGTELKTWDAVSDVITDARLWRVESGHGGKVHSGFNSALNEVWDPIQTSLAELDAQQSGRSIWFTGHSLGGALATLAADRFGNASGVYTFGAPRVGDDDFIDDYSQPTYRFHYSDDIVPRLPPTPPIKLPFLSRYRHVGKPSAVLKYIDGNGDIRGELGGTERLLDRLNERYYGLFRLFGQPYRQWVRALTPNELRDHSPRLYAVHIWNNYANTIS